MPNLIQKKIKKAVKLRREWYNLRPIMGYAN